ncbi:hypothetical protein ABAC460_19085 [Asticcacaulis sp. AC460]|uniref:hypothetical protein n=1 Tax=Asticcacaulis sp. AC460 TaxID=1282360 RepID=UPI0003C3F7EE|nr:hypothetical protein [Asticcacaulis sp. AC460]ESQ87432.1 hypothetical protein ABAC460_19085 [Asticcacaulis sp. AC460]
MAATQRPAQHNDSLDVDQKRADQGETLRNKAGAPRNPHTGAGHDERGQYGKSSANPETHQSQTKR